MAVPAVNITIEKGVDFENSFTISNPDGSAFNLFGYTAVAKIKKFPSATISKSFSVSITPAIGKILISMGSSMTSELSEGRNYYDIIIISNGYNQKTRVIEGMALVSPTVSA